MWNKIFKTCEGLTKQNTYTHKQSGKTKKIETPEVINIFAPLTKLYAVHLWYYFEPIDEGIRGFIRLTL